MSMPLLYQLQNADYGSLSGTDFRVAVIDPDDSGLTASQVNALQTTQDKLLYAYTSIGEAESYRDYWEDSWTTQPPEYVLGENDQWEGNFRVEFWNADWQEIILDRVDDVLAKGYDGIYLDIVDGYTVDEVIDAYPGTEAELRQEMIDFVVSISEYAKAQNPDFAIIPQNAVGLLGNTENGSESGPNTAYLEAIDGLGVEDLWYNDNQTSSWTEGDLEYIALAQDAGKFVLATSYPSNDAKQATFLENAIANGLIPFAADRDLTGVIDELNQTIEDAMQVGDFNAPWIEDTVDPVEPDEPINPEEPIDPEEPIEPEEPTDPEEPVDPVDHADFVVDQFAVQYTNLDYAEIDASPYDLLIVEGAPNASDFAQLSDTDVANLVASGKTIVGYVSVGQTDDTRPYWNSDWTVNPDGGPGQDTDPKSETAPDWLLDQADSFAAAIVDFGDQAWQNIVINQVEDLANRGYNGIFLDNMLSYYERAVIEAAEPATAQLYAQEMMEFVQKISAAGKAITPDFVIIPNGAPYIVTDAGYAQDAPEALAYYNAIDAVMAESFFGLAQEASYSEGVLDVFETAFADKGIDVLALEYSTDPDAIAAFAAEAEERGFAASVSADFALDALPTPIQDAPEVPDVPQSIVLVGTDGADALYGGEGDDDLSGLNGADVLVGNAGDDALSGGCGNDELYGGEGDDTLSGNKGSDYLDGGAGDDSLIGGRGQDSLAGGAGDDKLDGGNSLDELFGGDGNDWLNGGNSHDYLEGGAGNDVLIGGKGADELYGGDGNDQFVFSSGSSWDVIGDFDVSLDALLVEGLTLNESYETDDALILEFTGNTQVELTGLTADDLTYIDISFG